MTRGVQSCEQHPEGSDPSDTFTPIATPRQKANDQTSDQPQAAMRPRLPITTCQTPSAPSQLVDSTANPCYLSTPRKTTPSDTTRRRPRHRPQAPGRGWPQQGQHDPGAPTGQHAS